MKKIFLIILLFLTFFVGNNAYAGGAIDFGSAPGNADNTIQKSSIDANINGDFQSNIERISKNILKTIKIILGGILVIYMVYVGITMILAMGDDDDKLSSSKRQLWYALLGLLFINIPGTLYQAFDGKQAQITQSVGAGGFTRETQVGENNIFINTFEFRDVLEDKILAFLKVIIFALAVFIIVYEGIKLILSRGDDESLGNSKKRIFYSVLGLIFIGIMETWKYFAFSGDIGQGKNMFQTLANLALYFAGPIAIFFLSLAGYYMITAAGDEEKVTKAKSIVINTLLATLILLAMYTFLNDLSGLSFG